MLWKIFIIILSPFFLTSAWADNQSPIDIDSKKTVNRVMKTLKYSKPEDEQLKFYTTINQTGDQIVKIKLKEGGDPPALPWIGGKNLFEEIQIYTPSEHRLDHKSFDFGDGEKGDIDDVFEFLEDGKKFKMSYLNFNFDVYYSYTGSLLSPPYTEYVQWIINTIPKNITFKQREKFIEIREKLLDGHPDLGPQTREIQPINRRPIFRYIIKKLDKITQK